MYGLGQFHHRQNKGEGRFGKKKQQLLSKHRAAADGKNSQKQQWPTGPMPPSTQLVDQQQARN